MNKETQEKGRNNPLGIEREKGQGYVSIVSLLSLSLILYKTIDAVFGTSVQSHVCMLVNTVSRIVARL
jgi:hypothetical protein